MSHNEDARLNSQDHDRDHLDFEISDGSSEDAPVAMSELTRQRSESVATVTSKTLKLGLARRTLGIILMLVTVSMWTISNFLASSIFADDSYSKPYFVTWLNVGFFSLFLLRPLAKKTWQEACKRFSFLPGASSYRSNSVVYSAVNTSSQHSLMKPDDEDDQDNDQDSELAHSGPREGMFLDESRVMNAYGFDTEVPDKLTLRETLKLALVFTFLWFLSNLFVSACLQYTTVASSTVLGATSSAFTLAFGAVFGAERFTIRKLIGVAVCLLGVVMISQVDLSGKSDENRGSFPEKTGFEMAVGDVLALLAAAFYALYTILLKKQVGDESRLDVFTFFGFIGLFDLLLLWPGLIFFHLTGIEEFQSPPTTKIWVIVIINGVISIISDVCWTYSMLLTSPLVISVGVSLAIPMSLFGQMFVNGQSSSVLYWIGSMVVVASFLLINRENKLEAEEADQAVLIAVPPASSNEERSNV